MRWLVVACVLLAALAAPVAGADPGQWSVTGSGFVAGDHQELAAHSAPGGADPRGHANGQFTVVTTQFDEGGSIVCLNVHGNKALVLWRLDEPITVPELPGRVFPYGGMYVEDNGSPVRGQPVDRAVIYAVSEPNVQFFCADPTGFFGAAAAVALDSGNFVVKGG
jgi:hypothetical protein